MTQDQLKAFAFVESLVGTIDLAEQCVKSKSEHAVTHLAAVLGEYTYSAGIPDSHQVLQALGTKRTEQFAAISHAKLDALADYLLWVGKVLKERE